MLDALTQILNKHKAAASKSELSSSKVSIFRAFRRDEDGAIAIMFALLLIPMLALIGTAIDYSRIVIDRSQAQDALDAAVLATVKQIPYMPDGELRSMVEAFVKANVPKGTKVNIDKVQISRNPNTIKVWASGETKMTFMQLLKVNKKEFKAKSRAESGNQGIEVVMVLDNSGSMRYSMGSLKSAAKDLVDVLEDNKKEFKDLKIGVVPFNHLVRLDAGREEAKWLDLEAKSSVHRNNLPPKSNRFDLFKTMKDPYTKRAEKWEGCMEARPHPLDVQDTPATSSNANSYFIPFFYPDTREPNNNRYNSYNDYLIKKVKKNKPNKNTYEKYGEYYKQTFKKWRGPNYYCYISRLQPLTKNMNTVRNKLSNMEANGYTNIHMGTIWGLRLLSPQAPYSEGASYNDTENRKFLIVMTDGANTYSSHYQAYGWSGDGRISGSRSIQKEMNNRTEEACQAAKSNKVEVFTIAYNNPGSTTKAMMKRCGTNGDDDHYFDASNASKLKEAFEEIAKAITKVRITE